MSNVVECCSHSDSSSLHKVPSRLLTLLPCSSSLSPLCRHEGGFCDTTDVSFHPPQSPSVPFNCKIPASSQRDEEPESGSQNEFDLLKESKEPMRNSSKANASGNNHNNNLSESSSFPCTVSYDKGETKGVSNAQHQQTHEQQLLSVVMNQRLLEYIALDIPLQLGMGSPYSSSCTILFSS